MPHLVKEVSSSAYAGWTAQYWDVISVNIKTSKETGIKVDHITGKLGAWVTIQDMDERKVPPIQVINFDFDIDSDVAATRAGSIAEIFRLLQESMLDADDLETNMYPCPGGVDGFVCFVNSTLEA